MSLILYASTPIKNFGYFGQILQWLCYKLIMKASPIFNHPVYKMGATPFPRKQSRVEIYLA